MSQSVTDRYVAFFEQGRTRLTGWLGEVELLFAKNVFGRALDVKASTIGPNAGRRQDFGAADDLRALLDRSGRELGEAIAAQDEAAWTREVTADLGTLPLQEALARILTHTAYHAGQAHLTLQYGNS